MATNDPNDNRRQDPQPMMIPAPQETERTRRKLRVDRSTAAMLHKLDEVPPGMRVLIIVDVRPDGQRIWSLAHVTAEG